MLPLILRQIERYQQVHALLERMIRVSPEDSQATGLVNSLMHAVAVAGRSHDELLAEWKKRDTNQVHPDPALEEQVARCIRVIREAMSLAVHVEQRTNDIVEQLLPAARQHLDAARAIQAYQTRS